MGPLLGQRQGVPTFHAPSILLSTRSTAPEQPVHIMSTLSTTCGQACAHWLSWMEHHRLRATTHDPVLTSTILSWARGTKVLSKRGCKYRARGSCK